MALFMALKIEEGIFDYAKLFSFKPYQRFQDEVDAILIGDGKQNLIKR